MTDEDFAGLAVVQDALRHFKREPVGKFGKSDPARFGKAMLDALDAAGDQEGLFTTIALAAATTPSGQLLMKDTEAAEAARIMAGVRHLPAGRALFERMAQYTSPKGLRSSARPAQVRLVCKLAWAWFENARVRPTITRDPSTDELGGRFVRACLHAMKSLPEELRLDAREINSHMTTLKRHGELPPKAQK